MSTGHRPSEDPNEQLFIGDLAPAVVFAGLFDVARSAGMGWFVFDESEADLDLSLAAACLEAAGGQLQVTEYRGRLMHVGFEKAWIEVSAYNRINAGGLPLAQAVVARVRRELSQAPSRWLTSRLVGHWAREAAFGLSPAMAWRNTEIHTPEPPAYLVRALLESYDERVGSTSTIARLALIESLRRNYRQAMQAWVAVDEQLQRSQNDPEYELSELVRKWGTVETPLDDELLTCQAVLEGEGTLHEVFRATRRAFAMGRSWDEMPTAWGEALVEHTLGTMAPSATAGGTMTPLRSRPRDNGSSFAR